jgi:hypothetical protein
MKAYMLGATALAICATGALTGPQAVAAPAKRCPAGAVCLYPRSDFAGTPLVLRGVRHSCVRFATGSVTDNSVREVSGDYRPTLYLYDNATCDASRPHWQRAVTPGTRDPNVRVPPAGARPASAILILVRAG